MFNQHTHALTFAGELDHCLEDDHVRGAVDHQVDGPVFEVAVDELDTHFRGKGY